MAVSPQRGVIGDDLEVLHSMVHDMRRQEGIHRPGAYWEGKVSRIVHAIEAEGLGSFRSSPGIGRSYTDVLVEDPLTLLDSGFKKGVLTAVQGLLGVRQLVDGYARRLSREARAVQHYKSLYLDAVLGSWFADFGRTHALPETLVGDPGKRLIIQGKEIGENYLRGFAWISDYSPRVDFGSVRTVFEIGGGFGAFAHTVLHLFPNVRKYLYLDVPPMLYVGTQYLKHFFGEAVVDYRQTRDLSTIRFAENDDLEVLAIAPWQLARVEADVDFFWNASSFQEMSEEIVEHYAIHAGRLLVDEGALGYFVYDGGHPDRVLSGGTIGRIVEESSGFSVSEVPAELSALVVPGHSFLGRRAPVMVEPAGARPSLAA